MDISGDIARYSMDMAAARFSTAVQGALPQERIGAVRLGVALIAQRARDRVLGHVEQQNLA